MIEVVVAVNHVPDRLVGHFLDFIQIILAASGAAIGDRIGRDNAFTVVHDEHMDW